MEVNLLLEHLERLTPGYFIGIVAIFTLIGVAVNFILVSILAVVVGEVSKGYTKGVRNAFYTIYILGIFGWLILGLIEAPKPFKGLTRTEYNKLVSNNDLFSRETYSEKYLDADSYFKFTDYSGGLTDSEFKIYSIEHRNGLMYLAVPKDYLTDFEKALGTDTEIQYTASRLNSTELVNTLDRLSKSQIWQIRNLFKLPYGIVTKIGDVETNAEDLLNSVELEDNIIKGVTPDFITIIMLTVCTLGVLWLCNTLFLAILNNYVDESRYTVSPSLPTDSGMDNDEIKKLAAQELDSLLAEINKARRSGQL